MPTNLIDWLTHHPVDRSRVNEHTRRMFREIAEATMSRTHRTRYDGTKIRDGDWGRPCPEPNCEWCRRPEMPKREHITRSREDN